jgi:hypothetical protein
MIEVIDLEIEIFLIFIWFKINYITDSSLDNSWGDKKLIIKFASSIPWRMEFSKKNSNSKEIINNSF